MGGRGGQTPQPRAVPSGVVALAQDLPWGSSSSRAPKKLLPCGETEGAAQAGQEAAGSRQPGPGVCRKLRQRPQHPLWAQKARLDSPSGEDARLCGPRASGLLVFFGSLYFIVLKRFCFVLFLQTLVSSNKGFVHTLDQA